MPVVASIGVYGTKSAVENLKKYGGATMDTVIEKEEDLDE